MRFVCGERICLERVRDTERWEWKRNEEIVINLSPLSLTYVSNNSYNNDLVVIIIIIIFFLIKFNQYEIPTNLRVTTNNITRVLEIRPSTLEFEAHILDSRPAKLKPVQSNSTPILQFTSPKETRGVAR